MTFKYVELFAGIGGFRSALDALGGECVLASEIDPFATRAYQALYDGAPELRGDITKIDAEEIPDHDLLVGGFPCQSFSVAGQRRGFEEARGTLFFEIARIASVKRPRLMLLENVKGLLSHDGGNTFEMMCVVLNDIGYAVDFAVLNSKHYGVPQNRERVMIVCSRDAVHEEWNVNGNGVVAKAKRRAQELGIRTFNFDWPTNDAVTTRLRDILEPTVAERYYLSEEKTATLLAQLAESPKATYLPISGEGRLAGWRVREDRVFAYQSDAKRSTAQEHIYLRDDAIADSVTVGHMPKYIGAEPQDEISIDIVGNLKPPECTRHGQRDDVYSATDYKQPRTVLVEVLPVLTPERAERRQKGRRFKLNGEPSFTLTAQDKHGVAVGTYPRYRIRKLTPRECWRLQAFTDVQFETAKYYSELESAAILAKFPNHKGKRFLSDSARIESMSDSQMYKQAGNAVTVSVIYAIGERLVPLLSAVTPSIPLPCQLNTVYDVGPSELSDDFGLAYAITSSSYRKTNLTEKTLGKKRITYISEIEMGADAV